MVKLTYEQYYELYQWYAFYRVSSFFTQSNSINYPSFIPILARDLFGLRVVSGTFEYDNVISDHVWNESQDGKIVDFSLGRFLQNYFRPYVSGVTEDNLDCFYKRNSM